MTEIYGIMLLFVATAVLFYAVFKVGYSMGQMDELKRQMIDDLRDVNKLKDKITETVLLFEREQNKDKQQSKKKDSSKSTRAKSN